MREGRGGEGRGGYREGEGERGVSAGNGHIVREVTVISVVSCCIECVVIEGMVRLTACLPIGCVISGASVRVCECVSVRG
jgi:hypothetical protein